jgi:hypothetical protein
MTKPADKKTADPFDSIAYCIEFWDGAIDAEDEIDLCLREACPRGPRHVRACDDVA